MLNELAKKSVLGNPIRLGIMIYLLTRERSFFKELQEVLEITPGNLDSHLKTLERDGFVKIKKVIADRPRTLVIITEKGAEETKKYLRLMKEILNGI